MAASGRIMRHYQEPRRYSSRLRWGQCQARAVAGLVDRGWKSSPSVDAEADACAQRAPANGVGTHHVDAVPGEVSDPSDRGDGAARRADVRLDACPRGLPSPSAVEDLAGEAHHG